MRKIATAIKTDAGFRRAMIYDPEDGWCGVYLFLFCSPSDGPCDADYWHEDVARAERHAAELLGIRFGDWEMIPDPQAGCEDDWLAPVRYTRDATGQSVFERLPDDTI